MQARMKNPAMILPQAMDAISSLYKAMGAGGVPQETLELVHLRASQINGCSACVERADAPRRPARPTSGSGRWRPGARRRTSPTPSGPRWR